jgi:NADPH2 dehydrogenase
MERWGSKDIMVALGRHCISTPDLPFRNREDIPLTPHDRNLVYAAQSQNEYAEYAFSPEFQQTTGFEDKRV